MKESQGISLPHLTNDIVKNARKTRLDAFAVALEGWRRGLKLKWYTKESEHFQDMIIFGVNPPGRLFSLSSDKRTHYFFRTRGDKVSSEAVELASEKDLTKEVLLKKGVPVPLGKGFDEEATDEEVMEYAKSLGYPLVLKPTNASLGNGVITNIQSDEQLEEAVHYVRTELEYKEVVVEQHIQGEEYRIYVVDDKAVAAYNRVPANITGDGVHTIDELIHLKNLERRKNARLNSCLIEIDIEIMKAVERLGYQMSSVPKRGEKIYLRKKTNVSSGGDPIDVLDTLADEYKQVAIDAVKAIPGLLHAGVDIMVHDDPNKDPRAVVIELNPTAQIGGALFPLRGKARDIPKAIIDFYFPETKGIDTSKSKVYFDMINVLEPLENRAAIEVEVSPAPMGKLYAKKYTVYGTVQRQRYHQWLKKHALDLGLHGYVKNRVFDEIEIVVAGTDKEAIQTFRKKITAFNKSVQITKIEEEDYHEPVTVGFEITERYNTSSQRSVQNALRKMEKNLKNLTKQKNRIEKDNQHILNSTSWKITEPVRKIGATVKKK